MPAALIHIIHACKENLFEYHTLTNTVKSIVLRNRLQHMTCTARHLPQPPATPSSPSVSFLFPSSLSTLLLLCHFVCSACSKNSIFFSKIAKYTNFTLLADSCRSPQRRELLTLANWQQVLFSCEPPLTLNIMLMSPFQLPFFYLKLGNVRFGRL